MIPRCPADLFYFRLTIKSHSLKDHDMQTRYRDYIDERVS